MRPAELEALVRRRATEAERAMHGEVERILGIADPAERVRAYAEFRRGLEDGEAPPAEADHRVVHSLLTGAAPAEEDRAMAAAAWTAERRRLALLHALRPVAAAGCTVAASAPFAVAVWRWGLGPGDAVALFLAPGPGLAGVALALVAAALLGRAADRADSLEGLAGPLVGALMAGTAGLAVAFGRVF